ncbi:MAG TPA: hypothetical protein VKZ76_01585 [Edaphocola sp.]|nr:hypothetical protein [Edaphocola sp.]
MQKHFFRIGTVLLVVLAISTGMTSCVKNYTCKCDIRYEGQPGLPAPTSREYEIKDTHKNAQDLCRSASKVETHMGVTTIEECDLF